MGIDRLATLRIEPGLAGTSLQSERPAAFDAGTSHRDKVEPEQGHPAASERKAAGVERVRSSRGQTRRTSNRTRVTRKEFPRLEELVETPKQLAETTTIHSWVSWLWAHIARLLQQVSQRPVMRELEIVQTATLGDKRLVAIVDCRGERFLIGVAANSVSLLTRLRAHSAKKKGSEEQ
jgi:hypothetical protein